MGNQSIHIKKGIVTIDLQELRALEEKAAGNAPVVPESEALAEMRNQVADLNTNNEALKADNDILKQQVEEIAAERDELRLQLANQEQITAQLQSQINNLKEQAAAKFPS